MRNTITTVVATDWDTIAEHEPTWRELVRNPNAHPDFVKAVIASRPEVKAPVLIRIDSPSRGADPFMAVGRLEMAEVAIDIGYFHFLRRPLRQLTIIHGGLLGTLDGEAIGAILEQVRFFLKGKKADRVLIAGVEKDSLLWTSIRKNTPAILRDAAPRFTPHWRATLPPTLDEYRKKSDGKHRSHLRRLEKKIGEIAGGETRVGIFTKKSEIDAFCKDAETIASATYHRGIGAGFADSPEMRRRLGVYAKNELMRGYIFYANSRAIAFWLGTSFGTTFFLDFTGYLPEFAKESPGLILYSKMIEDLYQTGGITAIDFGDGDAPYKQRFGDAFTLEADAMIYAATPLMAAYSIGRTIATSLRQILDKTIPPAFIAFIKKQWRSKSVDHGEGQ